MGGHHHNTNRFHDEFNIVVYKRMSKADELFDILVFDQSGPTILVSERYPILFHGPQDSHIVVLAHLNMLTRSLGRSSVKCRPVRIASKQLLPTYRAISTNNGFLKISEEIREAINSKKPVVALETTIYTHGRALEILA